MGALAMVFFSLPYTPTSTNACESSAVLHAPPTRPTLFPTRYWARPRSKYVQSMAIIRRLDRVAGPLANCWSTRTKFSCNWASHMRLRAGLGRPASGSCSILIRGAVAFWQSSAASCLLPDAMERVSAASWSNSNSVLEHFFCRPRLVWIPRSSLSSRLMAWQSNPCRNGFLSRRPVIAASAILAFKDCNSSASISLNHLDKIHYKIKGIKGIGSIIF